MVLLFHSGLGWLTGGFLGVSIFFTLSGYLITSLLLAEIEHSGTVEFKAFWGRRLRRLLPASLVAITAVVLVTPFLSTAVEESRIRGDAVSAVLYVSNWRYVQTGLSYEELFASMSPLLHLWSLSIEAQMYLLVPIVVIAVAAMGWGRRAVAGIMGLGIGLSVMVSVFLVDGDRLYYGTDSRAAELLIGALMACVWRESRRDQGHHDQIDHFQTAVRATMFIQRWLPPAVLVAVIGLARITTAGSSWVYSGALAAFAVLSAVLVFGSIQPGPLRTVLSIKPLVVIGQVSYGLYLFHWPIFVWMTPDRMGTDGVALFAIRMTATAAVTALSYVALETPIRRRHLLTTPTSTRTVAGAAMVFSLLLPIILLSSYRTVVQTDQVVLATVAPVNSTPDIDVGPTSLRVVVLGDSTAENIARAFADVGDPGLGVISAGVIGCPLLAVARVYDRPGATQDATYCPDNIEIVKKFAKDIDVVVIVAGVANQWDFERIETSEIVKVGSDEYAGELRQWMEDLQALLADFGVPVLIFDAPITRQSEMVLGDEPEAVAAWNTVITALDDSWVSIRRLPFSQFLSDPNSPTGRMERPDGVHLDRDVAATLARQSLIPLLRKIYADIVMEMNATQCRILGSEQNWLLNLNRCRVDFTSP